MDIEIPEKLVPLLFEPHRYKIAHGGRGSAKSWGFARALLTHGFARKEKILCARELQVSITESVHALLSSQIERLGLGWFYEIQNTTILGKNGTQFIFYGLKHNIDKIKSTEGVTKCWIEEAHNVSRASWEKLIPTIREPNSEIWISYNPELEEDETHQRFVVRPPTNAAVVEINWRDNPWFPDVLKQEMEDLRSRDYDSYLNVWEGKCRQALAGAVFADEMREAVANNRITSVPHVEGKPVDVYYDLGEGDGCAVWYEQQIGFEHHFIDYHYEHHKKLGFHIAEMQKRQYQYRTIWLPHDADYDLLGQDKTIKQQMQEAFPNADVRIVEAAGKAGSIKQGINLARTIFSQCFFDKEKCADGLSALRHWHFKKDEQTGKTSNTPFHDWSSHGGSAFMYFAMAAEEIMQAKRPERTQQSTDWMAM